jgi:hypothetical protein
MIMILKMPLILQLQAFVGLLKLKPFLFPKFAKEPGGRCRRRSRRD